MEVNIGDVRAQSLGAHIVEGTGRVTSATGNLPNTGPYILENGEYLRVAGQDVLYNNSTNNYLVDAATAARNINTNAILQQMGIEALAKNRSVANTFTSVYTGDATSVDLKFYVGQQNITTPNFTITVTQNTTLADLVNMINSKASAYSVPITARAENGRLILETSNGETIAIEATANGGTSTTINFDQLLEGASPQTVGTNGSAYAIKIGTLKIFGVDSFQVLENGIDIVDTNTSVFKNLYAIDVSTNQGAETGMIIVKKALQRVDTIRAQIGAVMNNLQSIFDSQKVAQDNTKEAENVIRNTDYAEEMANFTKLQIKMQSSIAMLAQANQLPQLVLQLLR